MVKLLVALLAVASAEATPVAEVALAASYFRLGLKGTGELGARLPMPWKREGSLLLGDPYIRPQAWIEVTPAYARVGPEVIFSPLALLELRGSVVATRYFGTFTSLIGIDAVGDTYSDDALDAEV